MKSQKHLAALLIDTHLSWAAEIDNEQLTKLLIRAGADVNKAVRYGETPLCWVDRMGREQVGELLSYSLSHCNADA